VLVILKQANIESKPVAYPAQNFGEGQNFFLGQNV